MVDRASPETTSEGRFLAMLKEAGCTYLGHDGPPQLSGNDYYHFRENLDWLFSSSVDCCADFTASLSAYLNRDQYFRG